MAAPLPDLHTPSFLPTAVWQAAIRLFDKFARAAIKTGYLRLVLPNGDELVYGDKAHCAAPVPKGKWSGGVVRGEARLQLAW